MAAFSGLTEAERERLEMLIEEAGEVIQAATKVLRFGYNNYHPDRPSVTNKQELASEIKDFEAVAFYMYKTDDIAISAGETLDSRMEKKLRFTRHQKGENQ